MAAPSKWRDPHDKDPNMKLTGFGSFSWCTWDKNYTVDVNFFGYRKDLHNLNITRNHNSQNA